VKVSGFEDYDFVHVKDIGHAEYLVQAKPRMSDPDRVMPLDVLVVNQHGQLLSHHPAMSMRWHGSRGVDFADGVLMYAEYPSNRKKNNRRAARVFRSRDRGRSWEVAFEQSGDEVRHFHFLQARPGKKGEWWLTSGDVSHESKIWISKDGGNSWNNVTEFAGDQIRVGGKMYPRLIFRLTDLVWIGNEVVWGTDDYLSGLANAGARVLRCATDDMLAPQIVGRGLWPMRSIVELDKFALLLSQGAKDKKIAPSMPRDPAVYLMPKVPVEGAPNLVHLFDVECYADDPLTGRAFTSSKASRTANNGTFFTFRAPKQIFSSPEKILKWEVTFT
jgi:hypothetical protein